jgi:polysaccharide biosynthesis protein PslH
MQKILAITYLLPNDLNSGDRLYTYYLFQSLAQHVSVTAIGLDSGGENHLNNWIHKVVTVPRKPRPQLFSLLSKYPNIIFQCYTGAFKKALRQLVQNNENYDVIICSHSASFWAAEVVNKERLLRGQSRIPTILVTHNHDTPLRYELAKNEPNWLKSAIFYIDAKKTKWYEKKAFLAFDKITAITHNDAESISTISGQKITILTPGYCGQINNKHRITQETNRQVVILGSYYWSVKQLNLRQLVEAASIFSKAQIKMIIVGDGPTSLFIELSQYPFVRVIGRVESFDKYLEESRMAIIAETTGGGFKLKSLDYVFRKVPMAVIKGTMAGMPLQPGTDYLEYPTLNELVEGVVQEIDNIKRLNLLASNALTACQNKFSWADRGRALYEIVCELTEKI